VSDYINLLVRIADIICNHPVLVVDTATHNVNKTSGT